MIKCKIYFSDETGKVQRVDYPELSFGESNYHMGGSSEKWKIKAICKYSGLKDKNSKDVYEGDVHRSTMEFDEGDEIHHMVCTWIKEWAMFAWLSATDGEYQRYIEDGAETLDEQSYWTYHIDGVESLHVCGNIYQKPEFLKQSA